jgi:signal transduction histidine kinase
VKLRIYILLFLLIFGLTPLLLALLINLPLVLERTTLFYQRAYLQNLRADFRDLDQHLASRHEMIRLLSKLPELGLILGASGSDTEISAARARYTIWINQILDDQRDVTQILFIGDDGAARFWLARDERTLDWQTPPQEPPLPNRQFVAAGLALQPGVVLVSRIRIDRRAGVADPHQLMTLNLTTAIGGKPTDPARGVVVVTIDIGGLAQFYQDTLWVNQDGSYLHADHAANAPGAAFTTFPGLAGIFAEGKLALWKDAQGSQLLWLPMFLTEDGAPLWVGRAVDSSPIDAFRNELMLRVLSIIFLLVIVVLALARWIAARAEHFGQELTGGISHILRDGQPQHFRWRGPREIHELSDQLTALAETHAEHLRAAQAHARELETSNRYKSQFLANVSHELRTPLNSILLLSQMLGADSSGLSASQRRQAQVIHEAGRDLRTLIDNILDISRIEAGHVSITLEWVEMRPLLEDLIELVLPQLAEKEVALRLTFDPAAAAWVYTDRDKLRQILKNFLANSVKFTASGAIVISVTTRSDPVRPVAISVSDTGIGIPLDKQTLIFEAFQQADGSTRRRYGGTGLGLSISRELATLLDGCIEVESAPGAGACFTLVLPLTPSTANSTVPLPPAQCPELIQPLESLPELPTAPLPTAALDATWVLLIEREVATLAQVAAVLAQRGVRVHTAADLDEGLETLHDEGEGCALVLLGAHPAVGNTCDTIRRLLQQTSAAPLPIVILGTPPGAWHPPENCGLDTVTVLEKPIDVHQLNRLLAEVLSERRI